MKKVLLASAMLVFSAGIFSFTPKKFADTYAVDVSKSKVQWNGSAADHYHPGVVNLKSGSVMVDGNKISGGKFVFDLTTIKNTDGSGDRLDGALTSPNYFDVAGKGGEASFEITGVSYTTDNTANISGNLMVKGASVPVSFPAKIRGMKDGKLFAEAFFSLDLTSVGIRNGVDIAVHLFANK